MTKREFIVRILADTFSASTLSLAVFIVAELLKPGFVTNYLNMSVFLLWCIIVGILYVVLNKK